MYNMKFQQFIHQLNADKEASPKLEGNMSYCRWENTYSDLRDCLANLNNGELSETEHEYRKQVVHVCQRIVEEFAILNVDDDDR